MKLGRSVVVGCLLGLALSLGYVPAVEACGGCIVQQQENTQVNSHRMIFSISKDATTLWDQIKYTGEPDEFAWVLPIADTGQPAEIGLSSDALFQYLDEMTSVQIYSPTINCNPNPCPSSDNAGAGGQGTGSSGGGVTVIAEETIGPFDTVQLQSSDPNALTDWLLSHNYFIPPDIQPVIDAYVAEGFNFLALRLSPGLGVDSMRPVRVTIPGANGQLPLRMVAAGTGALTPITLWVLGEGRYQPTNFSSFLIKEDELIWDWDAQKSNYAELRDKKFQDSSGASWLIEAAEPMSKYGLQDSIGFLVEYDVLNSGYGEGDPALAQQEATEDLAALFSTIPDNTLWVSRLYGELSRPALGQDLWVGASNDQSMVDRFLETTKATGTPPACPPPPVCDEPKDPPNGTNSYWDNVSGPGLSAGSCAVEEGRHRGSLAAVGFALLGALAWLRRRGR